MRDRNHSSLGTALRRHAPVLAAAAVGVVAFDWLGRVHPPSVLSDDGIRDALLVRDCTELGRCHLLGAMTSLDGVFQGAVWLDLLTAIRLLGGDAASDRVVVLALLAVGVATLFVVAWNWLRPALALPAAVLFAAALGVDPNPSQLVNASVSAFADVVVAAGIVCHGLSGRRRFLLAAAFALGAAINVHVAALTLAVPLLAAAALARPRPWRALGGAGIVLTATCLLTSSAALRANLIYLCAEGRLLPASAGAVALALVSAAAGTRFRRLSPPARASVLGALLVLPFVLAALWLVFRRGHPFTIPYLYPVMGPAAVLGAAIIVLPFELAARGLAALRWIPTGAILIALAVLLPRAWKFAAAARASEPTAWTFAEARDLADAVVAAGWSWEDLVYRVQGNDCRELLTRMSVAAPRPSATRRADNRQLQVVKSGRQKLPELAALARVRVVPLGPTEIAVLRDVESWLRPDAMRACRRAAAPAQGPVCTEAIGAGGALRAGRFLFSGRAFPEIHRLDVPPPYVATYEIALAPGAGAARDLIVTEPGWLITRVEGVRVEGDLPARRVRLHAEGARAGSLTVERSFGPLSSDPRALDTRYPPCIFEAEPGDPLQAPVEAG